MTDTVRSNRRTLGRILRGWTATAVLLVAIVSALAYPARADDAGDLRVRVGARLFRSLLAAQTGIESRAAPDGKLHVVVYGGDAALAEECAKLIVSNGESGRMAIQGLPVIIERADAALTLAQIERPAGIFLISALSEPELNELIRWSESSHIVLFSPFEGDVERGAAAGLSIEARVRPYLNLSALQAAGIDIKPFYLKVARTKP